MPSPHKNIDISDQNDNCPSALFVTTVPITLISFLLPWAAMLRTEGWTVDCATSEAEPKSFLLKHFRRAYSIGWSRAATSLLRYPTFARRIKTIVAENDYDVVHVHTPIAAFITRLALRRKGRFGGRAPKIIYTAHGFHFHKDMSSPIKGWVYRMMERLALSFTDVLVVMNDEDEKAAQALRLKKPCPVRKACFIQARHGGNSKRCARARACIMRIDGVGFDFAAWESLRERNVARLSEEVRDVADLPEGAAKGDALRTAPEAQLIMVAEFNANKRHVPLLFELARLHQHGHTFHLTLVGSGAGRTAIEAAASELNLSDHITFTGQISHDELAHHILEADVGLLVSEREGLPRSLMELIAGGVVVAGTPTRGIIEEVSDSRAIAPLSQSGDFGQMLVRLMEDPALRAELHEMQYTHARANYDLPLILDRYRELYRSLLSEENSPCA